MVLAGTVDLLVACREESGKLDCIVSNYAVDWGEVRVVGFVMSYWKTC